MTWADFDSDSSLERDLLSRALPLVPTASDGSSGVVIDMAANTAKAAMTFNATIGPTPGGCVKLLAIRPLLVGAAWKVVDLLFEHALADVGLTPDMPRGWSIKRKVSHAAAGDAQPTQFVAATWSALTKTYAETAELRHSLVHRRAHIDAMDALVGVDDAGAPLRPLSADEQEALARAALRSAEIVTSPTADERTAPDLDRQLNLLAGVHGEALPMVTMTDSLPEITAILDPDADGRYPFACQRSRPASHSRKLRTRT